MTLSQSSKRGLRYSPRFPSREKKGILITTLCMTTRLKREIYRTIFDGSAVPPSCSIMKGVEIIIQEVSLIRGLLWKEHCTRHTYFVHATGYPVTYTIYVIRLFTRSYIFLVFVTYNSNIERSNNDSALASPRQLLMKE